MRSLEPTHTPKASHPTGRRAAHGLANVHSPAYTRGGTHPPGRVRCRPPQEEGPTRGALPSAKDSVGRLAVSGPKPTSCGGYSLNPRQLHGRGEEVSPPHRNPPSPAQRWMNQAAFGGPWLAWVDLGWLELAWVHRTRQPTAQPCACMPHGLIRRRVRCSQGHTRPPVPEGWTDEPSSGGAVSISTPSGGGGHRLNPLQLRGQGAQVSPPQRGAHCTQG